MYQTWKNFPEWATMKTRSKEKRLHHFGDCDVITKVGGSRASCLPGYAPLIIADTQILAPVDLSTARWTTSNVAQPLSKTKFLESTVHHKQCVVIFPDWRRPEPLSHLLQYAEFEAIDLHH